MSVRFGTISTPRLLELLEGISLGDGAAELGLAEAPELVDVATGG